MWITESITLLPEVKLCLSKRLSGVLATKLTETSDAQQNKFSSLPQLEFVISGARFVRSITAEWFGTDPFITSLGYRTLSSEIITGNNRKM